MIFGGAFLVSTGATSLSVSVRNLSSIDWIEFLVIGDRCRACRYAGSRLYDGDAGLLALVRIRKDAGISS